MCAPKLQRSFHRGIKRLSRDATQVQTEMIIFPLIVFRVERVCAREMVLFPEGSVFGASTITASPCVGRCRARAVNCCCINTVSMSRCSHALSGSQSAMAFPALMLILASVVLVSQAVTLPSLVARLNTLKHDQPFV